MKQASPFVHHRASKAPSVPIQCLVALAALVMLACVLLFAVALIPRSWLADSYRESLECLEDEGLYPRTLVSATGQYSTFDNFTTAWSLNIAYHSKGSLVEDALLGTYFDSPGSNKIEQLRIGLNAPANARYPQYWHGWLVIFRPLLIFFNVRQISSLFVLAFVLLAYVNAYQLHKMRQGPIAVCLLLSLAIADAWIAAASLPLAYCFLLALAGTYCIARMADAPQGSEQRLPLVFCILGALTAFFDFLDTPLVTLGYPLCTYVALEGSRSGKQDVRNAIRTVVWCSLAWGVGYGGMFAAKWAISFLVMGDRAVEIIQDKFAKKVSLDVVQDGETVTISRIDAVAICCKRMYPLWMLKVSGIAALAYLACSYYRHRTLSVLQGLPLACIFAMPFAWYYLIPYHSYNHVFFTYRTLAVATYALLVALYVSFRPGGQALHEHPRTEHHRTTHSNR